MIGDTINKGWRQKSTGTREHPHRLLILNEARKGGTCAEIAARVNHRFRNNPRHVPVTKDKVRNICWRNNIVLTSTTKPRPA